VLLIERISVGIDRLFQAIGSEILNARSPNFSSAKKVNVDEVVGVISRESFLVQYDTILYDTVD